MSLLSDIVDRVLFPNREIHGIPVLDDRTRHVLVKK